VLWGIGADQDAANATASAAEDVQPANLDVERIVRGQYAEMVEEPLPEGRVGESLVECPHDAFFLENKRVAHPVIQPIQRVVERTAPITVAAIKD